MINSVAFQTRARTIDHLGREQIADCPTAISELWKNSYDAYSRIVGMHVYDGDYPIATIVDNGHGMNRDEFVSKWLVVGTESKTDNSPSSEEDRCGLPQRIKQGQKGIGRLSSANLGALLLVVSKRKNERFVASLIDWRIFENPYLYLMDIEVPVVDFDEKEQLLDLLPGMFEKLLENVVPSTVKSDRGGRVNTAWQQYSDLEKSQGQARTTFEAIRDTVIGTLFEEWHFSEWPLWVGAAEHGTILAMSGLQSDLISQLPKYDSGGHGNDSTVVQAREQLFQTLSNIADPFLTESEKSRGKGVADFSTRATARDKLRLRVIVDDEPPFDLAWLHELEHVVDGEVDSSGVFRGKVKAFGSWIDEEVVVEPAIDVPSRKDTFVGPFNLRLATYEQKLDSTSHSEETYRSFEAKSESYAGFLIYRNGLRVMPYGREGTDFFQIEKRRTLHAGREFWSLRRLFGRVALDKINNPNLRDKAGREGIIDNKAAKVFRDIIINILKSLARSYFGTDAALRKIIVPDRVQQFEQKKLEEGRANQKMQKRKKFAAALKVNEPLVTELLRDVEAFSAEVSNSSLDSEEGLVRYKGRLQLFKQSMRTLAIAGAPRTLGLLEDRYANYRSKIKVVKEMLDLLDQKILFSLSLVKPKSPRDIAYSELNSNAAFLHKRIRAWVTEGKSIISTEGQRLQELQDNRNKAYHAKMMPLLDALDKEELSLAEVSALLDEERDLQDAENSGIFESYVSALISLGNNIDLTGLAAQSEDVAESLREEVDRLHALAQLGITVEIIGHEIESLEQSVSTNLKLFAPDVQGSQAYQDVRDSHEALIDRLRFLSPLKLSGPKTRIKITGSMIFEYVERFFKAKLEGRSVSLAVTNDFLNFSIHDQPARIYPVFINLVNNAIYWAEFSTFSEKLVVLQVVDGKVVVSDNGPGVRLEDQGRLFELFFTRKVRGGRGVGLYLCRANLAASGHSITYVSGIAPMQAGANFVINFTGAKYD